MKKLSIIIPCYNVAQYVGRCIESLRVQNCNEVEYIFINDGSSDDTLYYLKEFEKRDPRVIVIDKKNEGVSKARNDALLIAKGEYVFFLDGDDYLDENACFDMLEGLAGEDCVIFNKHELVYSNRIVTFCAGCKSGVYDVDDFVKKVRMLPITPKMYKRELLRNNSIYFSNDLELGEVFSFFVSVLLYAKKIKVSERNVYNYVMRQESSIHKINPVEDSAILKTLDLIENITCNTFLSNEAALLRSVFRLGLDFSFVKYAKQVSYSKEIGILISKTKKHHFFNNCMKFMALKDCKRDLDNMFAILLALSSQLAYYCYRQYNKIKVNTRI